MHVDNFATKIEIDPCRVTLEAPKLLLVASQGKSKLKFTSLEGISPLEIFNYLDVMIAILLGVGL